MKQQLIGDVAGTLKHRPSRFGSLVVPTSATVSIWKPDGTTALPGAAVSGASATVGADGELSYALTAAQLDELDTNYVSEWKPVWDGETTTERSLFDVVKVVLYPTCTDEDLRALMGGHRAFFYRDPGRRYREELDRGFDTVYEDLEAKGRRPWLVIEASQLRTAQAHKALEIIFRGQARNPQDLWWALAEKEKAEYLEAMEKLPLRYDADESGSVEPSEGVSSWGVGRLVRY